MSAQVRRRPEQQLIHAFSSQRADQPFDKRMRQRHIRHTLYLGHLQHPQVGAPLVKPIQRVVVGAEARRTREPSNRMVEHTAQGPAIHGSSMEAKADDPPRVVVHHYPHPMASQDRRLAPEQVDAPQAILRMPQERQPGRTTRVGCRSIVRSEHSAHHVLLVDEVDGHLTRVTADPAYDTLACYGAAGARGARVVVPPTKTASLSRRGTRSGARDRTIRRVQALGRRRWKQASGYHQHARVENAFFRYTSIVGDCLRARSSSGQRREAVLACHVLNRMTELGRPVSYRIGR